MTTALTPAPSPEDGLWGCLPRYQTGGTPDSTTTPLPVWLVFYNLLTRTNVLGSAPAISAAAGGTPAGYVRYTPRVDADWCGLIDFGGSFISTGGSRYRAVQGLSARVFHVVDASGAPLTGLVPSWDSLIDTQTNTGVPTAQRPAISELGYGLYMVGLPPLDGQLWQGRIINDPIGSMAAATYTDYLGSFASRALGDMVPPVVRNFVPALNAQLGVNTPIQFDVYKQSGLLRRVLVYLEFPKSGRSDVVWNGAQYVGQYQGSGMQNVPDPGGNANAIIQRFIINAPPLGGWPEVPILHVRAYDRAGNEVSL